MDTYKIEKVISGKGKRVMVTAKYEGKTVTRHLVDGIGWHPDDNRPRLQSKLLSNVADWRATVAKVEKALVAAQQVVEKNGKEKKLALAVIPTLEARLAEGRLMLEAATGVYEAEVKENPLKVTYEVR